MATPTLPGPHFNSKHDLVSQAGTVIERAKDRAVRAATVQRITSVIARSIGQTPANRPAARTVITIAQIEASAAEGNRYAKAWATRISRYGIVGTRSGADKPAALKPAGPKATTTISGLGAIAGVAKADQKPPAKVVLTPQSPLQVGPAAKKPAELKPAELKPVVRAAGQEKPVYSAIRADSGAKAASPAQQAGKF